MINDRMPEYCIERASKILNRFKKALNGSKILVLGVAYKQDIADFRESPALKIIGGLEREGAEVSYYDPYVPEYQKGGRLFKSLPALAEDALQAADLVIVTTAHSITDYDLVAQKALVVFDTKNAMKNVTTRDNIELL